MQKYERYLPTAFDDSLTMLQKLNLVIERLNQLELLTVEMIDKWNEFLEWLENEGLYNTVNDILEQWFQDGRFETILEQLLLDEYAKSEWVNEQLLILRDEILSLLARDQIEVTVGATGDYATIREALDFIIEKPIQPLSAKITLLPDFIMKEQVIIRNQDLRYITIESNQNNIVVEPNDLEECIRVNASPEFEAVPVFYGQNAVMPTIDAKFMFISADITSDQCVDCNNIVTGMLLDNSSVYIKPSNGFTHFPFIGICGINGSNIVAHHCNFDENGNRHELLDNTPSQDWYGDGVRMWNSTFSGSYATANRCGDIGFHFSQSSRGFINKAQAIDCGHHAILTTTGSTCSARDGVFTDTIDDNVVAYASSKIDLRNSDCSRSHVNYGVIATRTSEINFENGIANNCGYSGIMANRGSSVDATNGTANNNGVHGIECANNSRVDFSNGVARYNEQDGLHCTHGSVIQGRLGNFSDNKRNGMLAFSGDIYANGCTANNNNRNIEATRGGCVTAYESTLNGAKDKGVLAYGTKVFISYSTINGSLGRGIEATQGGEITAENVTIDNSAERGVLAYSSKIHLSNSRVRGSGGRSIEATQGGEIVASNVDSGGGDYHIYSGGRIIANNSTGTANRVVNEISEHGFIISNTLVGLDPA